MDTLLPKELHACTSGTSPTIEETIDAIHTYDSGCNFVSLTCPRCQSPLEVRVSTGKLSVGYSYSAGSLHFEEVATTRVSGLVVSNQNPSVVDISYRGRSWSFHGPLSAREWVFLPEGSHAIGMTSAELELASLGVRIERIWHDFSPRDEVERSSGPPTDDYRFAKRDRLLMVGAKDALRRAFARLRNG